MKTSSVKVESMRTLFSNGLSIVFAVAGAALAATAAAQNYPTRPVRMIVPLAAGGGMDITARGVAQKMNEALGQSMVIDNRPGGGGSIGAELTAHAAPDGYTLMMASGTMITHKLLYKPQYDPIRDFAAITQVSSQPYVLVVNPAVPAATMAEFIAYAKANPGKLNFSSSGTGSLIHLTGELFNTMAGVKLVHIPYKGIAASYPDLFANQIQLTFASTISATPHIKSGKLRALGVTSKTRLRSMPELPPFAESGVPGFDVVQWYGILAPAATPRPIIDRVHKAVAGALTQPDVIARMASEGAEPVGNTPQEFAAHIKAELAKWGAVIKQAGIKGE
jgi:tripartite-type tricarboxylate transporter receptor subunit TctC